MSDYGAYDRDEPRRYRSTRTRPRERDEPEYVEETTFVERGKGKPPQDLVYRGRDRDDSVEDIPRDFPPPRSNRGGRYDDYDDYGPPRRTRSLAGRSRYDNDDDYDDEYAGAGAAAGYAAGRSRSRRDDRRSGYYSDESSPPPRRHERRKSGIEEALAGLGLGGVVGALTGKKERDRSDSRDRSHGPGRGRHGDEYDDRDRARPKGERRERQWAQAAQAAFVAGAVEAFRVRNEPGPWKGNKGKRIATAAIGAGGIDKLIDRDPENKTKRHLVEAVLGGLAANRLANGPREGRSDSRGRSQSRSGLRSRSRSIIDRFRSKSRGRSASVDSDGERRPRSQSRGSGLAKLAGAGAVAAAGKAIYDRVRSKSRGAKERRREESEDSYEYRRGDRGRDVGSTRDGARSNPDETAVVGPRGRNSAVGPAAGAGAVALSRDDRDRDRKRDSSTSSESSTDMENKRKKLRGKEYLTAALASIATIHAAHGVYQSMESSEKRHKLVAEGEMSKEEARKKRSKAWLQDAAAVGIAALGIKGAYSEWKEMNAQRHSVRELEERRRKRQKRREQRQQEMRMSGGAGPDRMIGYGPRDSYASPPPAGNCAYGGGYDNIPPPPMGPPNDRY